MMRGNPVTVKGTQVKVGDKAPDFRLVAPDLSTVTLADTKGVRAFLSVPSIDTPVCDQEIRRFNAEAVSLGDVSIYSVSADLPFALNRWCGAAGIDQVKALSDHRETSFGLNYGVLIEEMRLLARAVFVVDSSDTITYVEYLTETSNHPDYDAALNAISEAR